MHTIFVRNASEALRVAIAYLNRSGEVLETRNGPALTALEPVTTIYSHPKECIPTRAAFNPFFGLIESMWLLAGRDDCEFLNHYVRDFGDRYGDSDGVLWGSYGARWRRTFGGDQLKLIINALKADPTTRRAVLQMWDARLDLAGDHPDHPCNCMVSFRIRNARLDMTVFNRSNDAIMGAYGANAVQFGMLLTYVANMINVPTGKYYQVSNDLHAYVSDLQKLSSTDIYPYWGMCMERLVTSAPAFDEELQHLMTYIERMHEGEPVDVPTFDNVFLSDTVSRVALSHYYYRRGKLYDALLVADQIKTEDWRQACTHWLKRRAK